MADVMKDISLDVDKRDFREEGIALSKTGIWNIGKVEGKNTMQEARDYKKRLLALSHKVQSWVQKSEMIDIALVVRHLKRIIDNDLIESLYHHLVFEGSKEGGVAEHSINVTIFSLMVGIGMGYDKRRLLPLAMLAFLHDIGMYKLPQDILNKRGKLSEREFKVVQRHPVISAEILSVLGDEFAWLANLASQVHERSDGSGYPKGLDEGRIHEFAFIVGLVDMYSAMINDRPYRDRIEKYRAMKTIIASSKEKFPTKVVKVLLNQISLFPVGTHVNLNDRSVGRVIATNSAFPLKPTVEILYNHDDKKLKRPKIVDLSEQPLLYIIESIDERGLI